MLKNIIYRHTAPYTIEKLSEPLDAPSDGYVSVRFLYCGICGGDYSYYLGRRCEYPVSLGHEWIGIVTALGRAVSGLQVGSFVVTDFNYRCGKCTFCATGRSHLCVHNNNSLFSNRGFAKYANIHSNYLHPITKLAQTARGCLVEPLSCVIHAFKESHICANTPILICGGGSIGMLFCFYMSRFLHYEQIYVAEANEARLEKLIQQFHVKRYRATDSITYDTIIDCTNSVEGMRMALDAAVPGNKMCIMSHLYGLETSFLYERICQKELHVTFPLRNGEPINLNTAIELIQNYWITSDDCMIQIYDDVVTAFREKKQSPCNKQIICLLDMIPVSEGF